MTFKIGDKVRIIDGSFSILMQNNKYDKGGVCGSDYISGTVLAVGCRLPFVPTFLGIDSDCPTHGVSLSGCHRTLFNDLLVQTDEGFIFTSSECVKLVACKTSEILCLYIRQYKDGDYKETVRRDKKGGNSLVWQYRYESVGGGK